MPPLPSDQSIRRLVAEFADARPEDVEAILAELNPAQRRIVSAMVEEYRGARMTPADAQEDLPAFGFSPWLAERAGPSGSGGGNLTPAARAALRSAVATERRVSGPPPRPPAPGPLQSLLRKAGWTP